MLGEGMRRVTFELPMSGGGIVNDFYNNAENVEVEYTASGISVTATVDDKLYGKYQRYVSEE